MPFWIALISGRLFSRSKQHDQFVQIAGHECAADFRAGFRRRGEALVMPGHHLLLLLHGGVFFDFFDACFGGRCVGVHYPLQSLIESAKVPACSRMGCICPEFSAYLKAM